MPSITIRDVPSDVRDELAARAARHGQSLQQHLRSELIELARRPTVDDILDRARRRRQALRTGLTIDQILEYRDAERR